MGFFFSQQKQEAARNGHRKGLRNAPTTKQNAAILNRLGCAACPLDKADVCTPKMQPTLAKHTEIYFLAEAPGRDEDENTGRPLTGPSGALLRECIPVDFDSVCSFDNVVRDRPPKNRTPEWTEIECCRNNVVKSIEEAKPKLIVGLGVIPLSWALNSTDMAGMRGRVFAIKVGKHQCWFMPTYHPSFILRVAFKRDQPLRSKMGHCFKMDLRKAFELLNILPPAKVDTEAEARAGVQCFDGSGGYDDLLGLLKRASKAPIKAIDIETQGLRPYGADAAILTAAISFDDVDFSFAIDHPKNKWKPNQAMEILDALDAILKDDTIKIAHNAPFELEWFIDLFGREIVNHGAWECTMMQAHFLDERRGKQAQGNEDSKSRATYQSLDFLCKQHFGIAYKKLFKLPKKDMKSADLNETLTYNAVDTKYTLRLWHVQKELLLRYKLWKAYREALPRQPTVAIMQHIGIAVDPVENKHFQKELEYEIGKINAEIDKLKVIKTYRAEHNGEFNPMGNDLVAVFRDYLKRPEIYVKGDKHKILDFDKSPKEKQKYRDDPKLAEKERISLDKAVLETIPHPLAGFIIELRNYSKLKSTYVDCFEAGKGEFIWPDSKLHTSFNTTFTETGRLSSDEPNQQNWPKRNDSWVRKQIVPKPGNVLLAFDYGQLEGCTAAMCSRDKVLVNSMWENYDIHMEWAQKIAARYPAIIGNVEKMKDRLVAKKFRSLVKNKMVFPAIFGASNESISEYLNIPIEPVDDIMDEFWATFTGLKSWQDRTMKDYYETGYVSSLTGRRHHYPLTRNQVINFPVQNVAAVIVCDSMNKLSQYAVETGEWYLHPILNIHDDLTFEVPKDKINKAIDLIKDVMLHPEYSFINVPLSVEVSQGNNWFEMSEIGKFWSNKDI